MMSDISTHFKKLALLALLLIVIGVIGAAVVGHESGGSLMTLEAEVEVAGIDQVSIRTRNQRVRLHPVTGTEARVISAGIPSDATLVAEVVNGILTIETKLSRQHFRIINFGDFQNITEPRILDVYLPMAMYERVTINSTNGRIEVSDFEIAELIIETTNGAIELENLVGNIDVQSTNGRITASSITGDTVRIRTTNGAIELSDLTGHIDAQTTNGRASFHNETIQQNVSLRSTNGAIEVDLEREPEHAVFNLRTTNGRTTIFGDNNSTQRFGDERYEVTLRTTNGRVVVE